MKICNESQDVISDSYFEKLIPTLLESIGDYYDEGISTLSCIYSETIKITECYFDWSAFEIYGVHKISFEENLSNITSDEIIIDECESYLNKEKTNPLTYLW